MAPASPTHTASRAARLSKLRSSCNACGSAKVKCDREQPSCHRCRGLGVACTYGTSRKSGRPPRSGVIRIDQAAGSARTSQDEGASLAVPVSTAPTEALDSLAAVTESDSTSAAARHASGEAEPIATGNLDLNRHENVGWMDPYISGPWAAPTIAPFGLMDFGLPGADSSSTWKDSHVNAWKDCEATNTSHICSRESYQILADLICPAPHLHPPESNNGIVTAYLDQVLHCNRKAIDRLTPLLRCSCSRSVHRVMMHASILSRILMWYQQAAEPIPELDPSSTSNSTPGTLTASSSDTSEDLTKATGFAVIDTPATLGTFSIDDSRLQVDIRNQVVLAELEKMSELIDLFSSHFTNAGGGGYGVAALYAHATGWIKDEYIRITQDLRDRCNDMASSAPSFED